MLTGTLFALELQLLWQKLRLLVKAMLTELASLKPAWLTHSALSQVRL